MVFVAIYLGIAEYYQQAVAGLANVVLSGFEYVSELVYQEDGSFAYDVAFPDGRVAQVTTHHLTYTFLGLALLPALLMATPIDWSARLRLTGLGAVVLLATHVLMLVALVRVQRILLLDPYDVFGSWVRLCIGIGGQLSSFAIWGILSWRYWIRRPEGASSPAQRVHRNAKCPCGSGRKYKDCCRTPAASTT